MASEFCKRYVQNIFNKYDTDLSNVLEKRELKMWMNEEVKAKPLRKKQVMENFNRFVQEIDSNGDNKIDRWEMYDYCVRNFKDNQDF